LAITDFENNKDEDEDDEEEDEEEEDDADENKAETVTRGTSPAAVFLGSFFMKNGRSNPKKKRAKKKMKN
jgi:hypothetical protein